MSPIFPFITDFNRVIEVTKEYVDEYWFENLNLRGDYKKTMLDYIKQKYPDYYQEYLKIYVANRNDYWVDLAKEIDKYCLENNIKYKNYFYHEEIVKK